MAFASLPGARAGACGCSHATAQILPPGIRRLPRRSRALSARSCTVDGEAIVTDQNGLAVFDLIRGHRPSACCGPLCPRPESNSTARNLQSRADRTPQEHPEVAVARQVACEGSRSTRTSSRMAQSSTARLGRSVARASCRSAWLALSLRPRQSLAQDQEPGRAGGEARSGGGVGREARHEGRKPTQAAPAEIRSHRGG